MVASISAMAAKKSAVVASVQQPSSSKPIVHARPHTRPRAKPLAM